MTHLLKESIRKILVIKLRAIGDVLLSTPVIQNLREHFPDAQIDFFTEKYVEDVVRGNPWLSDVLTFDRTRDSSIEAIARVRKRNYDLVIDLFSNPRSAVIAGLSGSPVRVGFPFRWRKYAYNVLIPPRTGNIHNVEFNLDALRRLGILVRHTSPHFPLDEASSNFADQWVRTEYLVGKELVGLNPGGGWVTKKWGLEHFAKLGDLISERWGASIVLLWGPGEERDAATVRDGMKARAHVIPPTSVSQLGGIIGRCSTVVSNDSGPMHIAAALGIPTLGIFGPTNPLQQGPYGPNNRWVRNESLDCLECSLTKCPIGNLCMSELTADQVFKAFQQLRETLPARVSPT
ncbi:MAG TPA: glycosyltransferase family 9 protein [Bacteroidota bacterium]|nr:glycosyltransferase family 9 protein [Bacteroidota bacterium]